MELREAQEYGLRKIRMCIPELRKKNLEDPDLSNRLACVSVVGDEEFGFEIRNGLGEID